LLNTTITFPISWNKSKLDADGILRAKKVKVAGRLDQKANTIKVSSIEPTDGKQHLKPKENGAMRRLGWFLAGATSLLVVQVLAATVLLTRARGLSAREEPTGIEKWIAGRARAAALPPGVGDRANPVPKTEEVLAAARAHWADHCASCHANDGSGETVLGTHMYPPAPDMRRTTTQNLTDGELFYIIQNGIRLTGMPGWAVGADHDEEDSWKLVHFIRHLPDLTMAERKQMEKLNPKSPDEWKEEQEEEKFLNGEGTNEPQQQHHHH
jgi:mono/diheme cytochrome c family protein